MFTRQQIENVWAKAKVEPSRDGRMWRKDFAGAWIRRDMLGMHTTYGWTVSRLQPVTRGGSDQIDNLVPAHWRNNMMKSNNYPVFETIITSHFLHNVVRIQKWRVS